MQICKSTTSLNITIKIVQYAKEGEEPIKINKLDGSRRKAVDGYASAYAHSPLLHMLARKARLSGGDSVRREEMLVLRSVYA